MTDILSFRLTLLKPMGFTLNRYTSVVLLRVFAFDVVKPANILLKISGRETRIRKSNECRILDSSSLPTTIRLARPCALVHAVIGVPDCLDRVDGPTGQPHYDGPVTTGGEVRRDSSLCSNRRLGRRLGVGE